MNDQSSFDRSHPHPPACHAQCRCAVKCRAWFCHHMTPATRNIKTAVESLAIRCMPQEMWSASRYKAQWYKTFYQFIDLLHKRTWRVALWVVHLGPVSRLVVTVDARERISASSHTIKWRFGTGKVPSCKCHTKQVKHQSETLWTFSDSNTSIERRQDWDQWQVLIWPV